MCDSEDSDEKPCCSRSLNKESMNSSLTSGKTPEIEKGKINNTNVGTTLNVNAIDDATDASGCKPRLTKNDVYNNYFSTHKVSKKDVEFVCAKFEKERSESEFLLTRKVVEKLRQYDQGHYPDHGAIIAEIIVEQFSELRKPSAAKTEDENSKIDSVPGNKPKKAGNKKKGTIMNESVSYTDDDGEAFNTEEIKMVEKLIRYEKTLQDMKKYHKELKKQLQKIEAEKKKMRRGKNSGTSAVIFHNKMINSMQAMNRKYAELCKNISDCEPDPEQSGGAKGKQNKAAHSKKAEAESQSEDIGNLVKPISAEKAEVTKRTSKKNKKIKKAL